MYASGIIPGRRYLVKLRREWRPVQVDFVTAEGRYHVTVLGENRGAVVPRADMFRPIAWVENDAATRNMVAHFEFAVKMFLIIFVIVMFARVLF